LPKTQILYTLCAICVNQNLLPLKDFPVSPIADLNFGHRVLAKNEADRSRYKLVASTAKTIVATSKPLLTAFTAAIMEALPWQ
jgi:hypothetical protein